MSSLSFRTFAPVAALLAIAGVAGAQNLSLPVIMEGDVGASISVPVTIDNAPNLVDAYGFTINYDPDMLEFTGFTFGDIVDGFSLSDANSSVAGQIIVGGLTFALGTEILMNESGTLGTATFDILACPETPAPITFSNIVDDILDWTTQNGSFRCEMAENTPPVAQDFVVHTDEDEPLSFGLLAIDADDDPLTYTIASQPSNGTLEQVGDTANVTYTPDPDFNGLDTFTFFVDDEPGLTKATSNTATATVIVDAVNDAPVANDAMLSTPEDTPLMFAVSVLTGMDVDGDPLTFALVDDVTNGSLTLNLDGSGTYTPAPDFNGMDSFTFVVNDGTVDSNTATVMIDVTPVNDPPVAFGQMVSTPQDTPIAITLDGDDVDGDALSFAIGDGPMNGSLGAVVGGVVTYTPDPGFFGMDNFTFFANDGTVPSTEAGTVSIDVQPAGDCTVSLSSESGVPGGMVSFTLDVSNSPGIDEFGVSISYDDTLLDFQGFSAGSLTGSFTTLDASEMASGEIDVFGSTTGDPIPAGSSGSLIELEFLVLECPGVIVLKGEIIPTSFLTIDTVAGAIAGCSAVSGQFTCDNRAPVADAGEDVSGAATGEKVTLDGSGSFDPDLDFITYSWVIDTAPDGSTAALDMADTPMACITPDLPGTYVICLTVSDGDLTDEDCVTVMAVDVQDPCPVADAGEDQSACVGEEVCLDGTDSFVPLFVKGNGSVLTFLWEFDTVPQGSQAVLDDATSATPCFTPDLEGLYTLKLTVSDGQMCDNPEASMDFVDVTAALNAAPNADAGVDQELLLGDLAMLDASASDDPDDMPDPLSFAWSFVSVADGSALTNGDLANSTQAVASFLPDVAGVYIARVDVSDGKDTDGDNVMISVGNKVKQDVTELFDIMTSNGQSVLNPATRRITSTKDLSLTNVSDITVCAPVQVVISVSEPAAGQVDMPNADGVNEDGDFLFDLEGDVGPEDMAEFEIMFEYPAGVSFLFEVQVCGLIVEFPADQDEGVLFSSTR